MIDIDGAQVEFWLATYDVAPAAARGALGAPLVPVPASGADADAKTIIAVEVLHKGDLYAVALSTVADAYNPVELNCTVGFCNSVQACDLGRQWGFPIVEAAIRLENDCLLVSAPFFAAAGADDPNRIRYEDELLRIQGVKFAVASGSGVSLQTTYRQPVCAPDPVQPASHSERRQVQVAAGRSRVVELDGAAGVLAVDSRFPNLAPLETGGLTLRKAWSGLLEGTKCVDAALPLDTHPAPTYYFDDCEVLGFRIGLGEIGAGADALLEKLVAPLNFHLDEDGYDQHNSPTAGDFRYRAASSTIVVELLRYGKMRLADPDPPLRVEDFQGQHELLVRILVGRVDDDTSQARDPAAFVPAIFVDNPWSKIVGRERQGFDKRLVTFFADPAQAGAPYPLRPDGCWRGAQAGQQPMPLNSVSEVCPVNLIGAQETGPILRLDCQAADARGSAAGTAFDVRLALGSPGLGEVRWRQTDFDEAEFRRSFAGSAVRESLRGFRSIQVAPVDRRGLGPTWITGTFELQDVRVAFPSGIATLEFFNLPADAAPDAKVQSSGEQGTEQPWDAICNFLRQGGKSKISLPNGAWYQFGCSMKFTVDDGLAW